MIKRKVHFQDRRCPQCHDKKRCAKHASMKIENRISPGQACLIHKKQKKKCPGIRICHLGNKEGENGSSQTADVIIKQKPAKPEYLPNNKLKTTLQIASRSPSLTPTDFLEENEQYWFENFTLDPKLMSVPSQDTSYPTILSSNADAYYFGQPNKPQQLEVASVSRNAKVTTISTTTTPIPASLTPRHRFQ